jgi:predicted glycoside hydrolase/deacetylase ChbG (UPF0249 family)
VENATNKKVILCADDYALSLGISRAIIDLIEKQRLSAVSCMSGATHWPEHAPWLKTFIGKVDIGLHVTLVDETPLTTMPSTAPDGKLPGIGALIVKSHASLVDLAEIEREVTAQFDAFESALGRPPDHIDGHLHAHVLPGIADVIRLIALRRAPTAYWRNVAEPARRILRRGIAVPKALFISALGARAVASPANDGFSGLYALRGHEDVPALFAKFLDTDAVRPLVMCHPGEGGNDPIARARENEYRFMASDRYADLLKQSGVSLKRFSEL